MASRIVSLPIDCTDPELVAGFWTRVLGWTITKRGAYGVTVAPQSGGPFEIDFRYVPDGPKR